MKLWRQGDIFVGSVESVPTEAKRKHSPVLIEGEVTGHSHRVEGPEAVSLWETEESFYVQVFAAEVRIVHEEHAPITLPTGLYRVWRQREYTPGPIRFQYVVD